MNITWKKHFTGISLSVLMVAGLVGCTSSSASSNQENTTQKTEAVDSQTNQQSSSVSYPITVSNYSINDATGHPGSRFLKRLPHVWSLTTSPQQNC